MSAADFPYLSLQSTAEKNGVVLRENGDGAPFVFIPGMTGGDQATLHLAVRAIDEARRNGPLLLRPRRGSARPWVLRRPRGDPARRRTAAHPLAVAARVQPVVRAIFGTNQGLARRPRSTGVARKPEAALLRSGRAPRELCHRDPGGRRPRGHRYRDDG